MKNSIIATMLLIPAVLEPGFALGQAQTKDAIHVSFTTEESGEQRINMAGKLRMLSQRIPSAACHLTHGIDVEGARALLANASSEFEAILNALEYGDPSLNIQSAERNKKALRRIADLKNSWSPFGKAVSAIIDQDATEAEFAYVLNNNLSVLNEAQLLVEKLVGQYSNPNSMSGSSLMLIDISGRQRMLTQKMSKEFCLMANSGQGTGEYGDPEETMRIFEASLDALRFGLPAVGIIPPPNEEISEGLEQVLDDWTEVKPIISAVIAGKDVDMDSKKQKFQGLNTTMTSMNVVVQMYSKAVAPSTKF